MVAKTIVELALRNQRGVDSDGARGSASSAPFESPSGAEADHAAVATCVDAVLRAAGLTPPADHRSERASASVAGSGEGRATAARVVSALARGVPGCPVL
jgi:hypothetical protein